jgi:hypothetical protein
LRAGIDDVQDAIVVIVLVFCGVEAPVLIFILARNGRSDHALRASIERIWNPIVIIVVIFSGVLAPILVMIELYGHFFTVPVEVPAWTGIISIEEPITIVVIVID